MVFEVGPLLAFWIPEHMSGKQLVVDVEILRLGRTGWWIGIPGTFEVDFEDDGVAVSEVVTRQQHCHDIRINVERNKAHPVCENFVLDDRGVVVDIDMFDCNRGNLGKENTAQSVRDGRVDSDKIEVYRPARNTLDLNLEVLCFQTRIGEYYMDGPASCAPA